MSRESRENAESTQEHLGAAKYHLERAGEHATRVKDPALQKSIKEATQKTNDAHETVKKGLESK